MQPSESGASAPRDRQSETTADRAYLRALVPPGAIVYGSVRHVSRSGMARDIALYVVAEAVTYGRARSEIVQLPPSRIAGVLTSARVAPGGGATRRTGYGMDMVWDLVRQLDEALYGPITGGEGRLEARRL